MDRVATKVEPKRNPYYSNIVGRATFAVGVEGTNAINVAIQLQDANYADLSQRAALQWYLSDDANGDTLTATAPSSGIAIGTDGLLIEHTNNKAGTVVSESDGDIDVTLTEAGVVTWYLVLVLPDGSLAVSGAITFA